MEQLSQFLGCSSPSPRFVFARIFTICVENGGVVKFLLIASGSFLGANKPFLERLCGGFAMGQPRNSLHNPADPPNANSFPSSTYFSRADPTIEGGNPKVS